METCQGRSNHSRVTQRGQGFTLIAVFTLALGIGANTSIFSVVKAAPLNSLPYKEADRLVEMNEAHFRTVEMSLSNFVDWQRPARSLEEVAASRPVTFNLTGLVCRLCSISCLNRLN